MSLKRRYYIILIYFIGRKNLNKIIKALIYPLVKIIHWLENQKELIIFLSINSELCQSTYDEKLAEIENIERAKSWLKMFE